MLAKHRKKIFCGALLCVGLLYIMKGTGSSANGGQYYASEEHMRRELTHLQHQTARLKKLALKCGSLPSEAHRGLPTIYAITPTHARPVQRAELTRLSQTFLLVPKLHWIVVEDSDAKSDMVAKLLSESGVAYTHLHAATPKDWKLKEKDPNWFKPRGVLQRNTALQWLRDHLDPVLDVGMVYFADDDNTYSLKLFDEIRWTKGVAVWPVGLVGGLMVERPKVSAEGKVIGWLAGWRPERPFAIDMAGFAVNLSLLLNKHQAKFSFTVERGYQESELLKHLVTLDQLEVKAENCTQVHVWHTRTEAPNMEQEKLWKKKGHSSDKGILV